ncbi:hypothetical protein M407DRAFT_81174 [Tulasnella calospora MUT 4182]|uniref:Wax synthase domain-containing protein n=1 Tax=Tulasnella calospora MUT 4182 TaxID=1051891 RepID=A0A0C3KH07_9AGAM|nr:hypothetical protein M407DRAFT_81174 [Tulasnella calospora MUT 4182]
MFLPSVNIPFQAYPSFIAGANILFACIYSTTIRTHPRLLAFLRMTLSIPGTWAFIRFAWYNGYVRDHSRGTYLGMATMSLYGMMKLLEVCWIRELDDERPRWVLKPNAQEPEKVVLPIPTDVRGRLAYTFDYLSTIRGCSWFPDRVWDFAPPYASTYSPPNSSSRLAFLQHQLISLSIQALLMDVFDVFVKSIDWAHLAHTTPTPVTSLPLHLQITFSLAVLITTMLYLTLPYTVMTTIFVVSGAATASSCPPMFDSPFESASLRDFWSFRWHHIFRRTFGRMGKPFLLLLPSSASPKTRRIARLAVTFFLSTTLHLLLLTTLPPLPPSSTNPNPQPFPFLDWNTIKFFLTQPLGLTLESVFIFPLTEGLSPRLKTTFRRAFAWSWLLFTGRYWSDSWTAKGLFNADSERPIIFSLVRGVLRGNWII